MSARDELIRLLIETAVSDDVQPSDAELLADAILAPRPDGSRWALVQPAVIPEWGEHTPLFVEVSG